MNLDRKQMGRAMILLLLSIALLFSLGRLAGWVMRFADESLQMDLSAFYTAGEALNHRLTPYRSYPTARHAIWDGVDLFTHSRFLYPPQVAVLFRPLAWLPYAVAKRLWMGLSLAAVAASLALTGRVYGLKRRWALILTAAVFAALYYPLLTHLERGQIDALTLLLIVGASVGLSKHTKRGDFFSGVLLCAATLLKLHCVYLLPFLALRKKGQALLGYLACGALLALLTAVTPGGIESTLGYVRDEMPRIAQYGEWGTDEMRVPEEVLEERLQGLPEGATIKDGVGYQRESFSFVSNGTLVRVIQRYLQRAGVWVSNSRVSAFVLVALLIVMVVWQVLQPQTPGPHSERNGAESKVLLHLDERRFGKRRLSKRGEFLYWQIAALIVLLSAPLTWVMNLVWLLPLVVVVLAELGRPGKGGERWALILAALALVLIALPDGQGAPWITPGLANLIQDKYVIGEGVLLVSLLGYLPHMAENRYGQRSQ